MKRAIIVSATLAIILSTLSLYHLPGYSQEDEIGEIVEFSGDITILRSGEEIKPGEGVKLNRGDRIKTAEGYILLAVGPHLIYMTPGTLLEFTEYLVQEQAVKAKFLMQAGKIWVRVTSLIDRLLNFEIETPYAVAGVRGTVFSVEYSKDSEITKVYVDRGEVEVTDRMNRKVRVKSGYETSVKPGEPPAVPYKGKGPKKDIPDFKGKGKERAEQVNKGKQGDLMSEENQNKEKPETENLPPGQAGEEKPGETPEKPDEEAEEDNKPEKPDKPDKPDK